MHVMRDMKLQRAGLISLHAPTGTVAVQLLSRGTAMPAVESALKNYLVGAVFSVPGAYWASPSNACDDAPLVQLQQQNVAA